MLNVRKYRVPQVIGFTGICLSFIISSLNGIFSSAPALRAYVQGFTRLSAVLFFIVVTVVLIRILKHRSLRLLYFKNSIYLYCFYFSYVLFLVVLVYLYPLF